MQVIHSGTTYECATAVKCTQDKYIKLYDESGAEIISFENISDFSEYTISGGEFVEPCNSPTPISLTTYVIGGCSISITDWTFDEDLQKFYYEIKNDLISANTATCDVLLLFAKGTEFEYEATQEAGKITLFINPGNALSEVIIDSIQITRA